MKHRVLNPILKIKYDWKSYFDKFDEAHGRDPIEYRGYLLYRDGWMYTSTDHAGPEYEPPEDSREWTERMIFYWRRLSRMVHSEIAMLTGLLRSMRQLQSSRSQRLRQRTSYIDDATGKRVVESEDVTTKLYEERLSHLTSVRDECTERLGVLTDKNYEPKDDPSVNQHIVSPPEWKWSPAGSSVLPARRPDHSQSAEL